MSTMIQGTTQVVPNTTPLVATDRCDHGDCFAQAYVRVTLFAGGELLFCGHDYHKLETPLAAVAAHVHDERHELLPKPYDPATDNS